MIKTIKAWWHKHRSQRRQWQYESGYRWAAGELLATNFTPDELLDYINPEASYHPFDEGARQAVWDWKEHLK
jgi:hypothetical protein